MRRRTTKSVKGPAKKRTARTGTKKSSVFDTEHPRLGKAIDVTKNAVVAGLNAAPSGLLVNAAVSFVENSVAALKGEKNGVQASVSMAKDIAGAGVVSCVKAAVGLSRGAKDGVVPKPAGSNIVSVVAGTSMEAGKIIYGLCSGSLSGTDAMDRVESAVVGMAAAYVYGTVGQAVIPVPVVGAMVANMVGTILVTGFKFAMSWISGKMDAADGFDGDGKAAERRREVEKACRQMELDYARYASEFAELQAKHLNGNYAYYTSLFTAMADCHGQGDIDGFIDRVNAAVAKLGGTPLYKNQQEFDALMAGGEPLVL